MAQKGDQQRYSPI